MSKEHIIAVSLIIIAELFYSVMKENSKKFERIEDLKVEDWTKKD